MTPLKQYKMLLNSGDLLELYPELQGNWTADKKAFTEIYNLMMDGVKNIDVTYGEY